jgi:DtxR family Mn-dependent transcriptional regulator
MNPRHPRARRKPGDAGPTEKMREYLEVIYYLSARQEPVIAARLAEWMHVSAPTVTNIVARLVALELIDRDPRGEIRLTAEGYTLAETMVRRHRILERFLVDVMGLPWEHIHEEAVRLEHALSPALEERIAALVATATTCPHGNPIPGRSTGYPGVLRLSEAPVGSTFAIRRITEEAEEDTEVLRHFQSNALVPGTAVQIHHTSSVGITLQRAQSSITLTPQAAAYLWGDVIAPAP